MTSHAAEVNKLREMKVSGLIAAIVEYAEDRLELFIRAKATGLINGAFRMVETPINIGKAAVCASVGWIPFVGGVLSGAADYLITEGLVKLREIIIEFVVGKILEFVNPMVEKLAAVLKDGGAKAEEFLQPVFDAVKPVLADIQARIDRVLAAETALSANLAKARATIASVKAGAGGGRFKPPSLRNRH